MPEVVTCPQCERQLRVPDELLGQRVKCPTCGTNFTAAAGGIASRPPEERQIPSAAIQPQSPSRYGDDSGFEPRSQHRRSRAMASVKAPAICLLIVSIIGLLCDGFNFVRVLTMPPPKAEDVVKIFPGFKGQEKQLDEQLKAMTGPVAAAFSAVFLVLCLVTLFGSLAMLAGRMRWLGILGSIAAMVNLGSCCCVLGLPFGIWSLVVLLNENVKNAFE